MWYLWSKDLVLSATGENSAWRSGSPLLPLEGEVFEGCGLEVQRNEDEEKRLIGFFHGRIRFYWEDEEVMDEGVPPEERSSFRHLVRS